ncbi:hypothetical protein VTO42DRAFT_237 [Malbranchea cinnamomea]
MSRQAARMQDPAGGVPPQLLPHMHLVSNYRYPVMNTLSPETAVEYLLSAPKVVRELQPMHWMFLDAPPDGTVMLVWQPLNHLGTNFASDGYVWADVEQIYTTEVRGYNLEVWVHRCGYHPPHETVATHCRRRYRLVPPKTPNPNLVPVDPSLWIIHYAKAPTIDQLPVNRIPMLPQVQNILAQRRFLQSQGQLARKDFMLHDRNSWPTISLPSHVGHPTYPPGHPYAGQLVGRQQPGALYAPQQGAPLAGTPMKQPRGQRPSLPTGGSGVGTEFSLEEEDTTSGDLLDVITPRDISRMRYRNHHEWMEEIFASPYPISKITPVDLGLGRKGELESLTASYFYTPSGPSNSALENNVPAATGKMEPGKAEEFADAVSRKIAEMTADMEAMKKKHERRMNKIRKLSVFTEGEIKLREAYVDPSNTGPEFWRLEGRLQLHKEEEMPEVHYDNQQPKEKVDDIVREILESSGKSVTHAINVVCVDKGGLLENAEPSTTTTDVDAGSSGTAQQQTTTQQQGQAPSTETAPGSKSGEDGPNQVPQPASSSGSGATGPNTVQSNQKPETGTVQDVEMGGMQDEAAGNTGDQASGDWVMVHKEEGAPEGSKPGEGAPASDTAGNGGMDDSGMLTTSNFDDVSGLNSAGEALAAYGEQNDGLDLGGLDNSAFGDAFHATETGDHVHHDTDDIP